MKILFSGHHNPRFFTITEYLESAIRGCGYDLVSFEDRRHSIPSFLRKALPSLRALDLWNINRRLRSLAFQTGPELAIVTGGHRVTPSTIGWLKARGISTVLWTIDVPLNFGPVLEAAPRYDHIFCQGTEAIEKLQEHGISGARWLPMAADPDRHKPVDLRESERNRCGADIAFVGSHYPNREKILRELTSFKLAIWGPGWPELPAGSPLAGFVRGGAVPPEEWIRIYCASKIVIVIHYQDDAVPCYQASPKVFEALACGSFVLVDGQKDVFRLFEDGKHLVKWNDREDLRNKIAYFLSHAEDRQRIAAAGRSEALAKHTYEHRIRELVRRIKES